MPVETTLPGLAAGSETALHDASILGTRPICAVERALTWPDEAGCAAFASAVAARLIARPALRDAVIELQGPFGAGKTTFVRHLLRALGFGGRVKSPTYTVMEPYRVEMKGSALDVAHFDFYRFDDPREWEDAGFRESFAAPGLKLVEWPEQARAVLPAPDLRLVIEPAALSALTGRDGERQVHATALTARGLDLLG